jgi:uncharacterized membrane protein
MADHSERIDLTPHCCLSTRSALLFFAGVCAGSFGVAGLVTAQGFWPVLPFAGLEMLVLAWALKTSLARREQGQSIFIDDDVVRIESRHGLPRGAETIKLVFPRYWAQVKLLRAHTPLHPSRLTIESHGRACEVGQFLTEEERRSVAGRLARAIGRVSEAPPLAGASGRFFSGSH